MEKMTTILGILAVLLGCALGTALVWGLISTGWLSESKPVVPTPAASPSPEGRDTGPRLPPR